EITPDSWVLWQIGPFALNATIVFTWAVMLILVVGAATITRRLSYSPELTRWQNLLEVLVGGIRAQLRAVSRQEPGPYLPFVGTLFLFIAVSNVLAVVPGWRPPTASLSTTTALALCVAIAVPVFGIAHEGLATYLRHYVRPNVFMLPFN